MEYTDEVIKVCSYCKGAEPCYCPKHDYKITMWKWVYDLVHTIKGEKK